MDIRAIEQVDASNKERYGVHSPVKFQLLYVRPQDIVYEINSQDAVFQRAVLRKDDVLTAGDAMRARARLRNGADVVLRGDWDMHLKRFKDNVTRKRIFNKIQKSLSWRDAGCYDWMERALARGEVIDGCKNFDDVKRRYDILDKIINDCEEGVGLARQEELCSTAFREFGGIAVAVTRYGSVISASAGNHRLSIAQFFDLKQVPVCICAVHPHAIASGWWGKLLEESGKLAMTGV